MSIRFSIVKRSFAATALSKTCPAKSLSHTSIQPAGARGKVQGSMKESCLHTALLMYATSTSRKEPGYRSNDSPSTESMPLSLACKHMHATRWELCSDASQTWACWTSPLL
jgi:hypothetical protein